jgi:hypothetical protein
MRDPNWVARLIAAAGTAPSLRQVHMSPTTFGLLSRTCTDREEDGLDQKHFDTTAIDEDE